MSLKINSSIRLLTRTSIWYFLYMHHGFRILFDALTTFLPLHSVRHGWTFLCTAAGASQPQAAEAVVEAGRSNLVRLPQVCLGSWAACVGWLACHWGHFPTVWTTLRGKLIHVRAPLASTSTQPSLINHTPQPQGPSHRTKNHVTFHRYYGFYCQQIHLVSLINYDISTTILVLLKSTYLLIAPWMNSGYDNWEFTLRKRPLAWTSSDQT